MRQLRRP